MAITWRTNSVLLYPSRRLCWATSRKTHFPEGQVGPSAAPHGSAAGPAVIVDGERLVEVHLDRGPVGLGDGDLVSAARNIGGDRSGGAAADRLDRGRPRAGRPRRPTG